MLGDQIREVSSYFSKNAKIAFWFLSVVAIMIAVYIPTALPDSSLRQVVLSKDYQAGELADEDVYSPVTLSFLDEVGTREMQRRASLAVKPIFTFDVLSTMRTLNLFSDYMDALEMGGSDAALKVIEGFLDDISNVTKRIEGEKENPNLPLILRIAREEVVDLLRGGVFSSSDIALVNSLGYDKINREINDGQGKGNMVEVSTNKLFKESDVPGKVLSDASSYGDLSISDGMIASDLATLFVKANIRFNQTETERAKSKAAIDAGTDLVRVSQGDLLIAKDTVITERELRIIDEINMKRAEINPVEMVANALFLSTILAFTIIFLIFFIPYKFRTPLYLLIFLSGLVLTELGSLFMLTSIPVLDLDIPVDPMLPFILVPVLFALMTSKRRIGFTVGFVFAGFSVVFPTSTKYSFFYFLMIIEASIMFIRFGTTRIDTIYQAFYSSLFSALVTVAFGFLSEYTYQVMVHAVLVVVSNVLLTYVIVSILLPILERLFNIPTVFRLHELSSDDSPTLNRLNQVAQGTFNHTRNVSEMAYLAAKEVGVNAELARVGALYHDIGKAEHPEYFIENQNGKNAHDMLTNNLSAAVIKSHVKLGVEKGREIGLPQEVLDIISQHHGNDIIMYFYNEAKKNNPDGSRLVHEEDFRYNSDIPQTPEAAIVMLADCTEAASRTLKNPNTQKYDRLIMSIIISKINHNQLADSKLTLTDLVKIKDTFIRSLIGRDHQRIEYDKE